VSSGDVLVDDHVLLRILLDDEPVDLRPSGGVIATTGLWYHRLCRALANSSVSGALSRSLGSADPVLGARAVRAVTVLPEGISCTSLRPLAWPMAQLLDQGARLNLMSLEALAAAEHLEAEICLAEVDANPQLLEAASARGVPVRLIAA